jgi:hypothetical protein
MRYLILLAGLALSACATTKAPNVVVPRPPADKLVCSDEPGRPAGKGDLYTDAEGKQRRAVTDEEAAGYMVDLRAAGQSCRSDVDWLREWFKSLAG